MGYRLEGPTLAHRKGYDIVSDGVVSGSIQVPGSGQPIVLLADRQTTGGYPKIATVISADLPVLGRRRPGSVVRFAAVEVAAGEEIARRWHAELRRLAAQRRPVADLADIDLASLYAANLISGVVDAGA
jgi:allophanate hydrolase